MRLVAQLRRDIEGARPAGLKTYARVRWRASGYGDSPLGAAYALNPVIRMRSGSVGCVAPRVAPAMNGPEGAVRVYEGAESRCSPAVPQEVRAPS